MKRLATLSIILLSLVLSSCITRYVKKDHKSYSESFYSYYVSKYGSDLVFIGSKYHYIFKDDFGQIAEFTKPDLRRDLSISRINLSVNRDNEVEGSVILQAKKTPAEYTKKELNSLREYGFKERGYKLTKKITLSGIRYKPRKNSSQDSKNHFSRRYSADIRYKLNSKEKTRKALLTPVAMTADGALIIAGGVTIPLLIILMTSK